MIIDRYFHHHKCFMTLPWMKAGPLWGGGEGLEMYGNYGIRSMLNLAD
jgi:hypothetical protein